MPTLGRIASLHRYPVKSMQGEELASAEVTEAGVAGDRAYALLDVETGRIASAHHPDKWAMLLHCGARWDGDRVLVTLPDGMTLPIGAELESRISGLCNREVRFIEQAAEGALYDFQLADVPDAAPQAFVDYTLSLAGVSSGPLGRLPVGMQAPPGALVDVAPLHLVTTSSLHALAAGGGDTDIRRFRPNVVIDNGTDTAYVEADLDGQHLQIRNAELVMTMPTMRCLVPTLEQTGVHRDRATLATLARDNLLHVAIGSWACLGHYASVQIGGTLSVGDEVSHLAA